jgi:hypothetical protein
VKKPMTPRSFSAVALAALFAFSGCASTGSLYRWGAYDQQLFSYYRKPDTAAEFRSQLEAAVKKTEKDGLRVAPGLYAEIGTLYLLNGDRAGAVVWYGKERAAWPESAVLMDSLIRSLGANR